MQQIGTKAKEFSLPDENGKIHSLKDYLGKWVVLYFYPKDDTPGCTKEACSFRDSTKDITDLNAVVLGVSADSVASHKKFAEKYHLNFPILSDDSKDVIKTYDAWGIKKFMGREFEGVKRTTYLLNPKGEIAKVYENVNPIFHAAEIIKDIQSL